MDSVADAYVKMIDGQMERIICAIVMLHLQILQEERYLEETFGAAYQEYKRHTFRYLGRR